jgi:hypothetical protein
MKNIYNTTEIDSSGVRTVAGGGTGASNASAALTNLGAQVVPNLFLRTSSKDTSGNNAGGIVTSISEDGIKWRSLKRKSVFPNFSRDASTIWYNNQWVSVYTNAFTSSSKTFGLATTTNFSSWNIKAGGVLLTGAATEGTANNVWAPEWFVDGNDFYVLVRLSTTAGNNYGAPGMGYVKCLDPGTWNSWGDWTPFDNSVRIDANDFYIVKKSNKYYLFSHAGTHLGSNVPAGLGIINNIAIQESSSPFGGYSPIRQITEELRPIIAPGNTSLFFEGPSVVNLDGKRWRLYFQNGLNNTLWSIDSFDDFETWDINSLRKNLHEGFDGDGHGTVLKIDKTNYVGIVSALVDINSPQSINAAELGQNAFFNDVTADAFVTQDFVMRDSGIYWSNLLILNLEENQIRDHLGGIVANWGSNNGNMYVEGVASKNLPLQLIENDASNLSTGAYIIVRPSASATTNGTELRNAYAAAKTFTPNTAALSATNRATVILLPGRYDLGTTRLNLNTDFVDIIGLTDTPEQVVITSSIVLSDSGTIYQTANDVKIKGVTIDRTGTPQGSGASRAAAYFPFPKATAITSWSGNGTTMTITANGHGLQNGNSARISGSGNSSVDGVFTVTRIDDNSFSYLSTVNAAGSIGTATERFNLTYIENCVFSGTSDSAMRRSTEYAGTYKKCVSGAESFQTFASGVFEDCVAGNNSFTTQASGTFTRCTAGTFSFANATGTFTDCTCVSGFASGSGQSASGIFTRCVVTGGAGFGSASAGTATGIFTDCSITHSNSYFGTFTGTLRRCRFVTTGTSTSPLRVGAGAKIFDSTLIATGTGNSITSGSAVTISLAGCRMNKSINANVSNNLGTLTESYNLIDEDIN